ncbi:gamma-aminobutyric acid type B receptor subunit 2 isoform X1 [Nematostella vectensis]|uniref:gamma-aminobutyric acid type B receptor subunit 2 isoform X1 n=1 Tax=Nematostella vectensis TaxID=45351 RepID=UPI00138FF199|nr:gamma-aminobutyric acid type B receptor subunit 2 isoform X1 [Nematostella vectensis]XP_048589160.1 gamma-aminobutyric acid type B receptor subunit 2 isoform X1 [Nematostella vectensis]XP_048589161.1 gamma-aminobutyric acid type B receptor subunit 2 isoform X1 [Nematostella vectensis]XP_048589162.1 gamma-aminobutyric acid type B receptor subunit 2 isoform X1 [Nematostella vectensis]XP_048589163.1 gamma-aminobutyric acid type B receptor subunit 2 isoform X1 [Nematostella vectensis]XP_0485891
MAFIVFVLACLIWPVNAKIPLYVGGFFPLSPNKASVPGHALLAAAKLALSHVNNSDILPNHDLRMIIKNSKCDPAYTANAFIDLLMDERPSLMILGAACSDVTEILAELSAYRNLVQVSYASRSLVLSNRDKYPTLFRTLPSESARNLARVNWIEQFGWKNIALLYEKTSSDLAGQSNNQVIEELKKLNCSVVLSQQISDNQLDLDLQTLTRNDARIIVGTFYERKARQIFCQAFKSGLYGARYVWLLIGTYSYRWWAVPDNGVDCTVQEMQAAVAYSFIFNNQIFLGEDEQGNAKRAISGVTKAEYFKQYQSYLQADNITTAPNITAYAYDAVWVIAAALNQTIPVIQRMGKSMENFTIDPQITEVFLSAIQNIQFQGITGEVEFFNDGDRYDGIVEILQHYPDGTAVTVGYYYPREREVRLIGKGNLWPEGKVPLDRTIKVRQFIKIPLWLYIFVCLMGSLGIVLGLVFLAFNIKYRNKRYIKLSSPNLNNVVILGCILIYSTVFLYGLDGRVSDKVFTATCRARFCLLSLGFTIGFGAMFSKTWRVHQIFTNVKKVKKVVRDKDLFGMLGVIVLIDVLLLSLWMALHPPSRKVIVLEGSRKFSKDRDHEFVMHREECTGPHSLPWLVTFYAFHSLLLVFGLFLAFETRKISVPVLNDSRFIGISVYNVVLLCAIGVPLSHVSSSEPAAGFALICAVILFCTTVTLSVLFIPKVIQMWKDPDGNPLHGTMIPGRGQMSSTGNELSVVEQFSNKNSRLEAEISTLKLENKQLKRQLPMNDGDNHQINSQSFDDVCETNGRHVRFGAASPFKGRAKTCVHRKQNFAGEFDSVETGHHHAQSETEQLLSESPHNIRLAVTTNEASPSPCLRRYSLPSPKPKYIFEQTGQTSKTGQTGDSCGNCLPNAKLKESIVKCSHTRNGWDFPRVQDKPTANGLRTEVHTFDGRKCI